MQAHKRRLQRYVDYIKENPAITEDTADPRRISAYIDTTLRLKKAGGAGFTIDPTGKRRKKHRKPKTVEKVSRNSTRNISERVNLIFCKGYF